MSFQQSGNDNLIYVVSKHKLVTALHRSLVLRELPSHCLQTIPPSISSQTRPHRTPPPHFLFGSHPRTLTPSFAQTIRGITKTYSIPTSYIKSGDKITFKGKFNVNRIEFKVGKKSDTVPDIMKISFVVPADKK
jgi:hypothetical protein